MKLILRDSINRSQFFAKSLGSFGVPLMQALCPRLPAKVTFEGQSFDLGLPGGEDEDPFEDGFSGARCWAEGCLGWIWCQWLSQTDTAAIRKEVEFVVNRGMEMQERCANQQYRCLHDLWLLNCAILALTQEKLVALAERVVDSNGDTSPGSKDTSPPNNNGELFAAAWCGMLKYWILGNQKKAVEESEISWGARRYDIARFAPKPLVLKWLARDWSGFAKLQGKDLASWWEGARTNGAVDSETNSEVAISFDRLAVPGRGWCWTHCGLAMLAHRQGAAPSTDPFWFPEHALRCVQRGSEGSIDSPIAVTEASARRRVSPSSPRKPSTSAL